MALLDTPPAVAWPLCDCGERVRGGEYVTDAGSGRKHRRPHDDGRCKHCANRERYRERDRERRIRAVTPEVNPEVDEAAAPSADMRLIVRLRVELQRDKRRGVSFARAWADSLGLLVIDLDEAAADAWRAFMREQVGAWRSAYEDTPSPLAHFRPDTLARIEDERSGRVDFLA